MFRNPFEGARTRIVSARRHIETIGREATAFFNSSLEWRTEQRDDGIWENKIILARPLPDMIEAAAWDALQNLRASLDLAVCASAKADGATNLANTYFYFAGSKEQWESDHKGRTKAAAQYAIDIMRAYQPWPEGNQLLYALSKVSAGERHQMASAALMHNTSVIIGSFNYNGRAPMRIGTQQWDTEKGQLVVTETGDRAPIPSGYKFTSYVAFGPLPFVQGQPIVPILNALCNLCDEIVVTIESAAARA